MALETTNSGIIEARETIWQASDIAKNRAPEASEIILLDFCSEASEITPLDSDTTNRGSLESSEIISLQLNIVNSGAPEVSEIILLALYTASNDASEAS